MQLQLLWILDSINFPEHVGFLEKLGLFCYGSLESLVILALLLLPVIWINIPWLSPNSGITVDLYRFHLKFHSKGRELFV